jgi:hypothetical protein
MGVVFIGLILTSLLIVAFQAVPRLLGRLSGTPSAATAATEPSPASPGEPVAPEIVTVIAAVLEVERRLYHAGQRGRLTISRAPRAEGGGSQ